MELRSKLLQSIYIRKINPERIEQLKKELYTYIVQRFPDGEFNKINMLIYQKYQPERQNVQKCSKIAVKVQ